MNVHDSIQYMSNYLGAKPADPQTLLHCAYEHTAVEIYQKTLELVEFLAVLYKAKQLVSVVRQVNKENEEAVGLLKTTSSSGML